MIAILIILFIPCEFLVKSMYYNFRILSHHTFTKPYYSMFSSFCSIESVNNLREIQAMRRLSPHANLVELKEVIL